MKSFNGEFYIFDQNSQQWVLMQSMIVPTGGHK